MHRHDERIFVGVLRLVITVPGARTRKDRRQVVRSLSDRVRHRFKVAVHEIDPGERPTRAILCMTTSGNDGRLIRSILDQIVDFAAKSPIAVLSGIDVDVFRWHPSATPYDYLTDTEEENG